MLDNVYVLLNICCWLQYAF